MRSVLLPSRRLKEAAADSFFGPLAWNRGSHGTVGRLATNEIRAAFLSLFVRVLKLPSIADRLAGMRQRADGGIGVPLDCAPAPAPRGSAYPRFCGAHGAAQARQGPPGKMDSQQGGRDPRSRRSLRAHAPDHRAARSLWRG